MTEFKGSATEYPFDLYADSLPIDMPTRTRSMLLNLRDALTTRPQLCMQVVAYTRVRWSYNPSWIQLHAISRFTSHYKYISAIAKCLTPGYLEFGILPLIRAHDPEQWEALSDSEPSLAERISRRGILAFNRETWL